MDGSSRLQTKPDLAIAKSIPERVVGSKLARAIRPNACFKSGLAKPPRTSQVAMLKKEGVRPEELAAALMITPSAGGVQVGFDPPPPSVRTPYLGTEAEHGLGFVLLGGAFGIRRSSIVFQNPLSAVPTIPRKFPAAKSTTAIERAVRPLESRSVVAQGRDGGCRWQQVLGRVGD